jgi:hypothetical protein
MKKETLLNALQSFVDSRPGLSARDYITDWRDSRGRAAYRADCRAIANAKADCEKLINFCALNSVSVESILTAAPQGGRLSITENGDGFTIDYCAGQHYAVEYRRAVRAVLLSAVYGYFTDCGYKTYDEKVKKIRAQFGRRIAALC